MLMTFQDLMDAFIIKEDMFSNAKAYDQLLHQMKNNRVIPVIGAGLSVWADYPLWGALLAKQAKDTCVESEVADALRNGCFEQAASILERFYMPNNFLRILEEEFCPKKIDTHSRPDYQFRFKALFHGPIVTTNYDVSLERLLCDYYPILPESDFQSREINYRLQNHKPMILKLHGTIEDPEHLVLTENRYNSTYGTEPKKPDFALPLPSVLRSVFQGAPPLFLGCGLVGDRTCNVFQACNGLTGYALLELPKETQNDSDPMHPLLFADHGRFIPELETRLQQLDRLNLQVIWYPYQHHEAVGVLIEQLYSDMGFADDPTNSGQGNLASAVMHQKQIIKRQPLITSAPERLSFGALFDDIDSNGEHLRLYSEPRVHLTNHISKDVFMSEFYQKHKHQNVLIIGNAGAGKTTGLKALFLADTTNSTVLFSTVKDYLDRNGRKSAMLKHIRCVLGRETSPTPEQLIILDGLDEAFANKSDAISFMDSISEAEATLWIGCRSDYYYSIIDSLKKPIEQVAEIKWSAENAESFIRNYSIAVSDEDLPKKMDLLRGESSVNDFIWKNPFFLTLSLFCVDCNGITEPPKNEYELIELFLDNWYDAEKKRGTTSISVTEYYRQLFRIANTLYHKTNKSNITAKGLDDAVLGFFSKYRNNILGFVHWDFCVFLISKQIIDSTRNGDLDIIKYYPKAFLNDVTDMTWNQLDVLSERSHSLIEEMRDNLFAVYKQIHEPDKNYISENAKRSLASMDSSTLLALKDEIIYFSLRLPLIDKLPFFNYASSQKDANDSIIELGLAYGIGMSMSHPFALQFAKKLEPQKPAAILNQSWTVAFFGDQKTPNIYTFRENTAGPWRIARNVRLSRFKKNTEKSYRYRLFDIPLMFCFFSSRKWACDLSEEELQTINNCDIDWFGYSSDERLFLAEKKRLLVDKYKQELSRRNKV